MARVLIVDDSLFIAKQLARLLHSGGYEVADTASDGAEALEKLKTALAGGRAFDLITLDITMPKMDGIAALEEILNLDPGAKVVIVSALGKDDLVRKALLLGARSYIVKPLEHDAVLEQLSAIAPPN